MNRQLTTLVLLISLTIACGASARQKTLTATLTALDATSAGIVAWDRAKQAEIVAAATSEADGIAKLTAYKVKRDKFLGFVDAAYRLLAAAAVLDGGEPSLLRAVEAAALVAQAWDDLRKGTQ